MAGEVLAVGVDVCVSGDQGVTYAFNPSDGALRWQRETGCQMFRFLSKTTHCLSWRMACSAPAGTRSIPLTGKSAGRTTLELMYLPPFKVKA